MPQRDARRYRFDDGIGEIGIIAPVSHPSAGIAAHPHHSDGKIRTCLFSVWDHDLHALMRRGASDEDLAEFIRGVVQKKEERHHIASRTSCRRLVLWFTLGGRAASLELSS